MKTMTPWQIAAVLAGSTSLQLHVAVAGISARVTSISVGPDGVVLHCDPERPQETAEATIQRLRQEEERGAAARESVRGIYPHAVLTNCVPPYSGYWIQRYPRADGPEHRPIISSGQTEAEAWCNAWAKICSGWAPAA